MEKLEISSEVIQAVLNSLLKQEAVQLYIAIIQEIEKNKKLEQSVEEAS